MVYDYSKLEGKIIEKFGTRESFAKASGITAKSIYDKLNNKTIWKQPEISKAMELLSISGEDIELYFFKKKSKDMEQEQKGASQTWPWSIERKKAPDGNQALKNNL